MRGKSSAALIGALVLACFGGFSFAARPGGPPATVSFDDSSTYHITSDGKGIYGPGATADGSVCRLQGTAGNIELDLRYTTARWLTLNFGNPTQGASPFPTNPWPVHSFMSTAVWNPNTSSFGGLTDIPLGETWPAHMQIQWYDSANTIWRVEFRGVGGGATSYVLATRTGDATRTGIDSWIVETRPGDDIGKLLSWPDKGRPNVTEHGLFHLPCWFEVQVQP